MSLPPILGADVLQKGEMAKKVRDYTYLLPRLEREHPTIYADLKAGKYASPHAALVAAGLIKVSSPLTALKREWRKASAAEQREFLSWTGTSSAGRPSSATGIATTGTVGKVPRARGRTHRAPAVRSPSTILTPTGELDPSVIREIERIMKVRKVKKMGQVMDEMGFKKDRSSLGNAMSRKRPTQVRHDLAVAIEKWLDANKGY